MPQREPQRHVPLLFVHRNDTHLCRGETRCTRRQDDQPTLHDHTAILSR